MNTILLVSHGTMAEGMKKAAEMIVGNKVAIETLCLYADKDISTFAVEMQEILEKYKAQSESFVVLADLRGGSPYTKTLELLDTNDMLEGTTVIPGMNLPLLISLCFVHDFTDSVAIENAIHEAKENMQVFELVEEEEDL